MKGHRYESWQVLPWFFRFFVFTERQLPTAYTPCPKCGEAWQSWPPALRRIQLQDKRPFGGALSGSCVDEAEDLGWRWGVRGWGRGSFMPPLGKQMRGERLEGGELCRRNSRPVCDLCWGRASPPWARNT